MIVYFFLNHRGSITIRYGEQYNYSEQTLPAALHREARKIVKRFIRNGYRYTGDRNIPLVP